MKNCGLRILDCGLNDKRNNKKHTGETPVLLMGKMPMLRATATEKKEETTRGRDARDTRGQDVRDTNNNGGFRRLVNFFLVVLLMMFFAGVANAQTTSRTDSESQAAIDSLRRQVAAQQQRIAELEQAGAASEGIADSDGSAVGMYEKIVRKLSRMLPTSPMMWFWFVVGMVGEFVFFLRFVVQWWASERSKRTVVPIAFWHLSLIGTGMVLAYALYRIDPVFILAYGLNIFLYVRNLIIAKRQPALAGLMEKESE